MKRKNPDTSHAANAQADELKKVHGAKIMEALNELGSATYEEIFNWGGGYFRDKPQVGRRLSELVNDKKIYRTTITRPTSSGRASGVYAPIGAGLPSKEDERAKKRKTNDDVNKIKVREHERSKTKQLQPRIEMDLFGSVN